MARSDIPAAVNLFHSVGWQHQAPEWERMLHWSPDGCFVLEEAEGRIVGTVSTMPYGTTLGWIGMLVVAPDRQKCGLGQQLMRAALDHLIARGTERIMLDASEAGRSLYRKLGFRELYKVERWEGRASTYLGPRARVMRPQDIDAVLELDSVLFGVSRTPMLTV
jgi:ribosomal protein S18 acetylase RimI-like enzyme